MTTSFSIPKETIFEAYALIARGKLALDNPEMLEGNFEGKMIAPHDTLTAAQPVSMEQRFGILEQLNNLSAQFTTKAASKKFMKIIPTSDAEPLYRFADRLDDVRNRILRQSRVNAL